MVTNVEDLTIEYKEDEQLIIKEIGKEILTKGAWSTIIFRYKELNRKTGEFGPDKFSIRRYQKKAGEYKQQSKFTISNPEQAQKIIEVLTNWLTK